VLFIFSLSIRLTDELYYIILCYMSAAAIHTTHHGRWPLRLSCRILIFAAKRWPLINTYYPLLRSGGSWGTGRKTGFGRLHRRYDNNIMVSPYYICSVRRCSLIHIYNIMVVRIYNIMYVILFFVSTFYPPKPVRARVIKNRE